MGEKRKSLDEFTEKAVTIHMLIGVDFLLLHLPMNPKYSISVYMLSKCSCECDKKSDLLGARGNSQRFFV
jgi:hypothetical protein